MIPYITGILLLALAAHANITAAYAGDYTSSGAIIVLGLAIGIAVGSVYIGKAWAADRYLAAIALFAAVLICEAFSFGTTAERIVSDRDQAQLPFAEASAKRANATAALKAANAALSQLPASSPRLDDALKAATAAQNASRDKATEKHCAANCVTLLTAQITATQDEVTKARDEIADRAKAAANAVAKAQETLNEIKATRSSNPLADRLGLHPSTFDLWMAALASLGLTGLAACLLAYGAHGPRETPSSDGPLIANAAAPLPAEPLRLAQTPAQRPALPAPTPEPTVQPTAQPKQPLKQRPHQRITQPAPQPQLPRPNTRSQVAQFAIARLVPAPSATLPMKALLQEYLAWCSDTGEPVAPPADLADEIQALFTRAGRPIDNGQLTGIAIKRAA